MAFVNSKEIFDVMFEHNIVVSYVGPFDKSILAIIAENVEDSLWEGKNSGRKFFKIFIELAQNISLYSAEVLHRGKESEAGMGIILIKEYDDYFKFAAGNLVRTDEIQEVIEKCEKINTLDREGLREYKRSLRGLPYGKKGGGNIGLIQVALISKHKLDYKLIEIDEEHSFYIIGVRIDK